ncbi:ATPase associated with various cellular activities family protein, partial [Candidatus Phytoplasma oryzae]
KIPNDTQGETKIEDKSEIANLITNFFLNKKEELNNKKSIMLIGTTNNLDKIDKKLKNRFNEEIYVDLLKNEEIEGFLKHILLSYDISYHAFVYLEKLVQFCYNKNYSQRELKNIIEKAYIKSVANQRKNHSIYLSDLKESFEENKK